ncbi:ATPase, T2SS/T4P/T4SS family [Bradyrhizobium macuxiense]|uniref:ATPase, T2SS/T4P/T4SS family n=1 Tax=Bradyrhizobium macuxiense TaxID=1755647 RepID=UPI003D321E0C
MLIEDTRDLQSPVQSGHAAHQGRIASLSDLVRSSLRLRPDRIQSARRGAAKPGTLQAWGNGHPGGVGTIHTALGALRGLEQLIQEAVLTLCGRRSRPTFSEPT